MVPMGLAAPWCGSTLGKTLVGPPRRRGPKIQARMRRCFTEAACAAQFGRRRRAIPTLGERGALLRRYFKTASLQFC